MECYAQLNTIHFRQIGQNEKNMGYVRVKNWHYAYDTTRKDLTRCHFSNDHSHWTHQTGLCHQNSLDEREIPDMLGRRNCCQC